MEGHYHSVIQNKSIMLHFFETINQQASSSDNQTLGSVVNTIQRHTQDLTDPSKKPSMSEVNELDKHELDEVDSEFDVELSELEEPEDIVTLD